VVEHDIILAEPIESEVFEHDIACLSNDMRTVTRNGKPIEKKLELAGGAYFIKPESARELMRIRHDKKIVYNSDAWIHRTCDKFGKWYKYKSQQFKNPEVGVTIEHNKA